VALAPWSRGDAHLYEITTSSLSRLSEEARVAPVALTARGHLIFTVIGENEGKIEIRADLQEATVTLQGTRRGPLADAMERPFLVRVDPDGALREVLFESSVPAEGRQLLTGLVAAVRLAHRPERASWSAAERDAAGEYVGRYQLQDDQVTRTLSGYQRVWSGAGLIDPNQVGAWTVEGTTSARYQGGRWPVEVRSEGKQGVAMTSPALRTHHAWKTRARLLRTERRDPDGGLPPGWRELLQGQERASERAFERARRSMLEERVAGATFPELVGALRASSTPKERTRAMNRMTALLRLSPVGASAEAREAWHQDLDPEARGALLGALSGAGTREAQRVLAEIGSSRSEAPEVRAHALALLGVSPGLDPETHPVLEAAAREDDPNLRANATLALGNAAHAWSAQGREEATAAFELLRDRLAEAKTLPEIALCLDALGNTGDERALPLIEPFLRSPSPELRDAAIPALRLIPGERPDQLLAALAVSSDEAARKLAVQAMGHREPSPALLAALEDRARRDAEPSIRTQVALTLGMFLPGAPQALPLLRWQAEHDVDPSVRKAASAQLDGGT
jgi:hypothetical protein